MKKLFAVVSLLVLAPFSFASQHTGNASCATDSTWQEVGYKAASQGEPATQFYNIVQSCDKPATAQDEAEFVQGYMSGIESFCTYDNGYALGRVKKAFPNVCPTAMADDFMQGYEVGLQKHNSVNNAIYHGGFKHSRKPIHSANSKRTNHF